MVIGMLLVFDSDVVIIFSVCWNQEYKIREKEVSNFHILHDGSVRKVPVMRYTHDISFHSITPVIYYTM